MEIHQLLARSHLRIDDLKAADTTGNHLISSFQLVDMLVDHGLAEDCARELATEFCMHNGDPCLLEDFIEEYTRLVLWKVIKCVEDKFQLIDTDRSRSIAYRELHDFLKGYMDEQSATFYAKQCFDVADDDHDELLDLREIQDAYRTYHSKVQKERAVRLKTKVFQAVRVRPFPHEDKKQQSDITLRLREVQIARGEGKRYNVYADQCFDGLAEFKPQESNQDAVYAHFQETGLFTDFLHGHDIFVVLGGGAKAGKDYTMFGSIYGETDALATNEVTEGTGVLLRFINDLLQHVESHTEIDYEVAMTAAEVLDQVYDLFDDGKRKIVRGGHVLNERYIDLRHYRDAVAGFSRALGSRKFALWGHQIFSLNLTRSRTDADGRTYVVHSVAQFINLASFHRPQRDNYPRAEYLASAASFQQIIGLEKAMLQMHSRRTMRWRQANLLTALMKTPLTSQKLLFYTCLHPSPHHNDENIRWLNMFSHAQRTRLNKAAKKSRKHSN